MKTQKFEFTIEFGKLCRSRKPKVDLLTNLSPPTDDSLAETGCPNISVDFVEQLYDLEDRRE